MQSRVLAGAVALALILVASACSTSGTSTPSSTAAVTAGEPETDASVSPGPTNTTTKSDAAPLDAGPQPKILAAAPAGACAMKIAAVPPVPGKGAAVASSVAENAGRNVARNVGTNVAGNVVASVIPGFGAIVGVAATQVAGREIIRTAEDMRGTWTATDGAGCGCQLEFSRPGMVVAKKVVTPKGCRSPLWLNAGRWAQVERRGFAKVDLVLYAADGKTELARLDAKSSDYYQGAVGAELVTVWR
jgi:hypothetical protein